MYRGPRGPSIVNATWCPSSSCFAISVRPSTAPRGLAALRGAEAEALDHAARPLPIEIHRVQHHDAAISPDPYRGENTAMPERADPHCASRFRGFAKRCERPPLHIEALVPSRRIAQYTNHAITGIYIRRHRESSGIMIPGQGSAVAAPGPPVALGAVGSPGAGVGVLASPVLSTAV